MKLGEILKDARTRRDLTLRDVERETGISNGHLSLLESGAVLKPSPNLLEKLAGLYGVSYSLLLERAGYRLPEPLPTAATAEFADLTPQEREEVRRFVGYLRSSRATKRRGRS
jgi:transcriptional regulator with XRE-family HTH domain